MSNEDIVILIQRGEERKSNLLRLYEKNKGIISRIALSVVAPGVEKEDLMQEAYFAIEKAADRWSPEHGARFITYAIYWIRQVMIRYAADKGSAVRIPVHRNDEIRAYRKCIEEYQSDHLEEPTTLEISLIMGWPVSKVEEIRRCESLLHMASIDSVVAGDDQDITLGETVEDPRDLIGKVEDKIQSDQLKSALWGCVDELSETKSEVLRKRYRYNETLAACAEDLDRSIERVRQIEREAIKELQKPSMARRLSSFYEERVESLCFQSTGLQSFKSTFTSSPERAAIILEQSKIR